MHFLEEVGTNIRTDGIASLHLNCAPRTRFPTSDQRKVRRDPKWVFRVHKGNVLDSDDNNDIWLQSSNQPLLSRPAPR
jgi:hypothetical protein